jgi:phosphoglycolate phosphatase
MSRYRHIIWDWNGTLLDDLDLSIDIVNGMLTRRQLPTMDRERYHAVFDFPVRNYYTQLGFDTTDASFRELSREFIAEYDRRRFETQLHHGTQRVLDAVLARGMSQSILSAYKHDTLCEIVDHFGLTSKFARLSGLDDISAHRKAELGRQCIEALHVGPNEVVMIGDTLHDFDVAGAIGVNSILVAHGHHPLDRLAAKSPNIVNNLEEVAARLGL